MRQIQTDTGHHGSQGLGHVGCSQPGTVRRCLTTPIPSYPIANFQFQATGSGSPWTIVVALPVARGSRIPLSSPLRKTGQEKLQLRGSPLPGRVETVMDRPDLNRSLHELRKYFVRSRVWGMQSSFHTCLRMSVLLIQGENTWHQPRFKHVALINTAR